jgi:hypothetical protein
MPLSLSLVFHFNQHTSEYADTANRACYRGLLTVLRSHPKLKFNLHLSGTLLRALPWFDTESLALVRAGLAAGQFELLGSTYAQNVPYASDDWDNAQQIALHRLVLQEMFGVAPEVFWIAERCWRQSLLPVIVDGGYRVASIEDHILHAAGLADPIPAVTRFGKQSLTVVYDDTILRDRLNYAAWFGRRAQLFKYLEQLAERQGSESFLLTYAEDAEAMGLWGWEKGYLPQATWANLDGLLADFETSEQYRLKHLSEAQPAQTIGELPDGSATWMERSLARPDAPYHEDGYTSWFDFDQRSPKNIHFRRLYNVLRVRLQGLGSARSDPGFPRPPETPGDIFYRRAIEAFCHHQYEFGCIGVGGRGYWGWENARSCFAMARAAELADDPAAAQWVEDATGDGVDEQMLCNGAELAVFTAHGGRLLYWLDLQGGQQWVGNQLAVPPAPYVADAAKAPQVKPDLCRWLPVTFEPNLKGWQSSRQKEAAPTRMGRHLPEWIMEREPAELTVYRSPLEPGHRRQPLLAQLGAFVEVTQVDARPEQRLDDLLDYRFEPDGVTYLLYPLPQVVIEKQVRQAPAALALRYRVVNRDAVAHIVRLISVHELSPDYESTLGHGRAALTYYLHDDCHPAVRNNVTGTALILVANPAPARADCVVNLLALQVELQYQVRLEPKTDTVIEIELRRTATPLADATPGGGKPGENPLSGSRSNPAL